LAICGYDRAGPICGRKALDGMDAKVYGFDALCKKHWRACNPRIRFPGESWETSGGYISVKVADRGVVPEHVLVMEQRLGRRLVKGESVHHKDGIRNNNADDNLELWVGNIRYGQRAVEIICPHCGKPYGKAPNG
jgi:hypothetical protein